MTPCIRGEIRHAVKSVFQPESRNIYDDKDGGGERIHYKEKTRHSEMYKKVAVIIVSQFIRPFNDNNE